MSAIFTGIVGCTDWRPSIPGSRSWTCTAIFLLPVNSGNPITITDEEFNGVLHYFPPPGAAPPEDGVYYVTAKLASATPALVPGENATSEGAEYELDSLVFLPQEFRKYDVAPIATVVGRPRNIHDRSFDIEAQPYIFNGKRIARFACHFPQEGRFAKNVPRITHVALLHVTGLITGQALPREGNPEQQLSLRILDVDFVNMASGTAASPTPITPGKRTNFFAGGKRSASSSTMPPSPSPLASSSSHQDSANLFSDPSQEPIEEEEGDETVFGELPPSKKAKRGKQK